MFYNLGFYIYNYIVIACTSSSSLSIFNKKKNYSNRPNRFNYAIGMLNGVEWTKLIISLDRFAIINKKNTS